MTQPKQRPDRNIFKSFKYSKIPLTVCAQGHHFLHLPAPVQLLLLLQRGLHGSVQDGGLHHLPEGLREVVHGDHLQCVPVHAPQVVHEAAAGGWLHHVVGHPLTDLHGLQQVGDKQELREEVLTLRHGGPVAKWLDGGGGGGGRRRCRRRRRSQHQPTLTRRRGN